VEREPVGLRGDVGSQHDFPVGSDSLELAASLAFSADLEGDFLAIDDHHEVRGLLSASAFEVKCRDVCLTQGEHEEIFPQATDSQLKRQVEQPQRRHEQNFRFAQEIGPGRKQAQNHEGLFEGIDVLLGFVFGDSEIGGEG
jgi:hypothetical protein